MKRIVRISPSGNLAKDPGRTKLPSGAGLPPDGGTRPFGKAVPVQALVGVNRSDGRWRMAVVFGLVGLDLGLQFGHVFAARHPVGDLLSGFLALAEIRRLCAPDEH